MLLILGVFLFLLALEIPLLQPNSQLLIIWPIRVFGRPKMEKPAAIMWGSNVCASCHAAKAASKKQHRWISSCTLQRVRGLAAHSDMNFKVRNYKYKIETLS
jgi:hypothetical protein